MKATNTTLLARYTEACNYPGTLDVAEVEKQIALYLQALGVQREIVQLKPGWELEQHPPLLRYVKGVFDHFSKSRAARAARDAMAARAARDAMAARDARAARAAMDAMAARAAMAAMAARAAMDARAARAARDAMAAMAAMAARAAMDARAARDARDAMAAMAAMAARDARDAMAARAAMAAMAAMDARDARAALRRFAQWCMQYRWWYWSGECSWLALTYIGAMETGNAEVQAWSQPVYEAFCAGAWFLHWTDEAVYWVAKPAVHVERLEANQRRLHCESGPAVDSAVEELYFWHGVLVPDYVVMHPEKITAERIREEDNAEVRRIMMERMGWERFCDEAQMKVLHEDRLETNFPALPVSDLVDAGQRLVTTYRAGVETAQLLEADGLLDFEERPLRFVRLTDPSTNRQYTIRVKHDHTRCYEAVGWTFGMTEAEYKSLPYLRQGDVLLQPLTDSPNLRQAHS